jgi:hypothetical protein
MTVSYRAVPSESRKFSFVPIKHTNRPTKYAPDGMAIENSKKASRCSDLEWSALKYEQFKVK